MEPGDIRIKQAIVHILDSTLAIPALSDAVLELGSDLADFLKTHICRVFMSDEVKKCYFEKEESEVYHILEEFNEENFVDISKNIAERLFSIMNKNIDIPQADVFMLSIRAYEEDFFVILKMNYKSSYTHKTSSDPWGNINDIVLQRAVLPAENQKLSEAVIISLEDERQVRLIEKKYEINGVKTNYFSEMFLQCKSTMSQKSRLAIVTKAIDDVQKNHYDESQQFEVRMEAKSVLNAQLVEGPLQVPKLAEAVFGEREQMKEEFKEKLEKYHLEEAEVTPQNKATVRKYEAQHLKTDTGIEIKIPMEQYNNKNTIEFITNEDGTISMLIKNIGSITSK